MVNLLKKLLIGGFSLMAVATAAAQHNPLSLDKCQELAKVNYPLIHKRGLIAKSRDYSIANANKGYLPQFSLLGQATYQSAITELPIEAPGIDVPQLKKDQYKVYGELNQKLFDGGVIKQQKESHVADAQVEEQRLEVTLYQLKEQVNQLFFGILTIDEQRRQNELLQADIRLGLQKTQAAIVNGTALKSEADVLQADLLNARQRHTELKTNREAYCNMLSLFINITIREEDTLAKPETAVTETTIRRPELSLYDAQLKNLDIQEKGIKTRNLPKFDFFFQGGYGRPALNILSPDFEPYYLGGIRLTWNFAGLYTRKNERSLIQVSRQEIDLDKEVFLFNNSLQTQEALSNMLRYQELLRSDDEIIRLRNQVKQTSLSKLENGVITSSDYLRDVHAEDQARLSQVIHEIQLLAAIYSHNTTTGN